MIINFKYHPDEDMIKCYLRFTKLLKCCPDHELPPSLVLQTLYGGLSSRYGDPLDSTCYGSFM
jgi:hypothetical protein